MRLSIGQKLTLSFLFVALLFGPVGYIGYSNMSKTARQVQAMAGETAGVVKLSEMKFKIIEAIEEASAYGMTGEIDEKIQFFDRLKEFDSSAFEFRASSLDGKPDQSEEIVLFSQILAAKESLKLAADNSFFIYETDGVEILSHGSPLDDATHELIPLIDRFVEIESEEIAEAQEEIASRFAKVQMVTIITVSVAALLAVGMGIRISRSISIPINRLNNAAARIGKGESATLDDVRSRDEIGDLATSFKTMIEARQRVENQRESLILELGEKNAELERFTKAELERSAELVSSLYEKEVLLKEINHRVKNNLQIISSLLNLQSREINDEQALNSFRVSQDRIRAMAMVHEKLYQSDDLAKIDFGEYVEDLSADLGSAYGLYIRNIKLKIDVENLFLGIDIAIPCGVIVNELVSNSLKHAFPSGRSGEINISFRLVDHQYTMTFKDDGVGFPENLNIGEPSTLGLTIVDALTGQLGGTIKFSRNGGSEVQITFPEIAARREG